MLFNYNTLDVSIDKTTKSMTIALDRKNQNNAINIEMLFELEGLLNWLTSHLEIYTLVLTSNSSLFTSGFDKKELAIMSEDKLKKYLVRFQKLVQGMHYLPQTIICDLKKGTAGMGLELSLGADIRICDKDAQVSFDALNSGWIPCCGGISLLSDLIGVSRAKQWTLCSRDVKAQELHNAGFIVDHYVDSDKLLTPILQKIMGQAPVAKIQAKRSFLEFYRESMELGQQNDAHFSFSYLPLAEWKKLEKQDFISAREFAQHLKENNNNANH